jgi:hypothetical protein
MRFLTLLLLLSAPAFAQSDTIMVMVRPAYTMYIYSGMECFPEQELIKEASFEGAIFDSIAVEVVVSQAYYKAEIIPPVWETLKKERLIPSKIKGGKPQKIKYEVEELISPTRLESVLIPAATKTIQRYTIRKQGDNTKPKTPAIYRTFHPTVCTNDREDFFYKIQHPAEYKIFPIK